MTRIKKPKVTLESLQTRQAEQERQVALLRSERTDAIIGDKSFDSAKLREAEDELSAIDAAITEFKQREADRLIYEAEAEAAVSEQERIDQRIADIRKKSSERETAISDAEVAARSFAEAVQRAEVARQGLQEGVYGLTGSIPLSLMPGGQEDRLAKSFSAVLSASLSKGRFGEMALKVGMRSSDQPWLAGEQPVSQQVEAAIEAFQAQVADQ